ncbi:MAG: DNA-binding protein WhiA [Christensenellales bacterium]|jgi:DNA-binding protein WhiA
MSFAADARSEIAHAEIDRACCARAELAAALIASGGISFRGQGVYRLALSAPEATTIRRYFTLIKKYYGVIGEIRVVKTDRFRALTRYRLLIPDGDAHTLLAEAGLIDPNALFGVRMAPAPTLFADPRCRAAYLRAAFLFCGTISNPEKSYHIEFAAPNEQFAQSIIESLEYYKITAKYTCRKSKEVVYLKGSEAVSDVLTVLGAHASVLAFENIKIAKELRNNITRQVNCDNSNINRAMLSAERQIADIQTIESELGLDRLPESLRSVAMMRMENPDISLAGLGEMMTPPLGKSGVNNRLRRIADIAGKLRSGDEIEL